MCDILLGKMTQIELQAWKQQRIHNLSQGEWVKAQLATITLSLS